MLEDNEGASFHADEDCSARDYLIRADEAAETGDIELAMHLYMVAFERSQQSTFTPDDEVVDGLREAWVLACELGERSIAEYIFDKLEPYLSSEEVQVCAEELQKLALGKLEEIGISLDDIDGIAKAAAHEILGVGDAANVHVERIEGPFPVKSGGMLDVLKMLRDKNAATDGAKALSSPKKNEAAEKETEKQENGVSGLAVKEGESFTYADIAGYESVIRDMRNIGIGLDNNAEFQDFIKMLNARHGLERMPVVQSLLFRSPAREDASEFMSATVGEIGHPAVRMRVEENMQGIPVLSVMAQADTELHLNAARTAFEGRGTLVLEDIDLWLPPLPEAEEGFGAMLAAQFARAAREALSVIRTAVENPDIHVLASASSEIEIPTIFYDLLDPFTCVDIDFPNAGERLHIWLHIIERHPSLGQVDLGKLVRYSVNMPRVDIYYAAREAIEESYRQGIIAREYVPVTSALMFEKLANYHPLDSDEYKELEEYVVGGFHEMLEKESTINDLFGLGWDDESDENGANPSEGVVAVPEASSPSSSAFAVMSETGLRECGGLELDGQAESVPGEQEENVVDGQADRHAVNDAQQAEGTLSDEPDA